MRDQSRIVRAVFARPKTYPPFNPAVCDSLLAILFSYKNVYFTYFIYIKIIIKEKKEFLFFVNLLSSFFLFYKILKITNLKWEWISLFSIYFVELILGLGYFGFQF